MAKSSLAMQPRHGDSLATSLIANYSIEITAKDANALTEASDLIAPGTPVSVTFLPGEEMAARVAAAKQVRALGFEPVSHLSARRLKTEAELETFLSALVAEAGVKNVFVVAGDPDKPEGPYGDSLDVIRSGLLEKHGIQKVGISGYPEGHPQISTPALWKALADKQAILNEKGLQFDVTTQFCFDADPVIRWIEEVRAAGVFEPLRIGIPGPASVKTLMRFAARCGVGTSTRVMAKYGLSIGKLLSTAGPDSLVRELEAAIDPARHGDIRLHFYPFGGLSKTGEWIRSFAG